jgi:Sec-independent protein translocase protein TatA
MEFLGVGPTELALIIILALVLIGPRDMAKFGREAGQFLNKLYHSATWRTMNDASREIRNLPTRLAREAEIDSVRHDLERAGRDVQDSVRTAAQDIEKDLKSSVEGMQAWTAPAAPAPGKPEPPPVPPSGRAPTNGSPPPGESPYAEG